jgi:clan AA aspartic protease (TIGR02281 family)
MTIKEERKPEQGILFRLNKSEPLVMVEVAVNGKGPFNFAVDTGASMTLISPTVARRSGVKLSDIRARAIGASGQSEATFGKLKSLRVGQAQVSNIKIAVMSMRHINRSAKPRVDGIIGYNFLKRYRVTIDYANRLLYLQFTLPRKKTTS